ncbi:MAG: hypothetical protein L3J31_04235 [Bacteroidales bacterium]|nr:hypothetical protein [Bacteroidales bacterium]
MLSVLKKYAVPFAFTLLVFSLAGFYPTDCSPLAGKTGCAVPDGPINTEDCTWNGYPLYGKIQFVESFPDIKIQLVESFPDIKVKLVDAFANDCGEWEVVESFPDVKVQFVESFPDIKVQFVESFPGITQ